MRREDSADAAPIDTLGGDDAGPPAGARVLLIEDSSVNRALLGAVLSGLGFDVTLAATFNEALRKLSESSFECIVSDVNLPDASGAELAESLRAVSGSTPIVAVTGEFRMNRLERLRTAGFDRLLKKPVDGPTLGAVIIELIKSVNNGGTIADACADA